MFTCKEALNPGHVVRTLAFNMLVSDVLVSSCVVLNVSLNIPELTGVFVNIKNDS